MLQIPIKHDDSQSCVDDIVVAIANWYGCDYQLMFSESWEFEFTAGSIILPREDKRYDLIGKYHSLKMTFHDAENAEQLIQKIMDELKEGRPIAIYIDTFWCPWYVGKFQEVHSDHFCIVLGYDEEKGAFYCIDGQMSTTPVELPVQMLKEGYDNYIAFRLTEDNEPEWDWQEIMMKAVDSIGLQNKDNNMFSSMTDFASYLNEGFNMSNEIHGYENEPSLAPIFQQLKKVNRGRKQFAIALGYIAEKKGIDELKIISDRLNKAGDIWISIYGMLIKSLYIDNPKQIIGRISKKVMEISDLERSIAEDLVKISKGAYKEDTDSSSQGSLKSSEFVPSDYFYVNLGNHFNNQGFSKDLTLAGKAEFSNIGKYFIDDGLSEKREWAVGHMRFRFPHTSEGKNDNLTCMGQRIDIESEAAYSSIMFLGCSEIGSHWDEVLLEYKDGTRERVKIEFTSWVTNGKPTYGEQIAWSGKAALRGENRVTVYPFTAQIYAKAYPLKNKKAISNITLPQCPNIHVFAISLGK